MNQKRWGFVFAAALFTMESAIAQSLPAMPLQSQAAVPGAVTSAAPTLTLADAIRMAIQNNLTSKLAKAATEQARGQAIQAAAGLLPHLMGSVAQSRVFKLNLAAEGFNFNIPSIPTVIGPFNVFDARLSLVQEILDFSTIFKMQAGLAARHVAELQERLAREQVATAAALAYLEAQRTTRAVLAAQADLQLAQSLLKLTRDQHQAGISTGVDVARSETSEAQEKLRLIRAQVAAQNADVRLKRIVGMPLDRPVVLADLSRNAETAWPSPEAAVGQATHERAEMQVATEAYQAAVYNYRSAEASHLPSLVATADYGYSGNTPSSTARTGNIGGRLDLPIFAGGQAHGRTVEAKGLRDEYASRLEDVRAQIEEDIRLALQNLAAETQETQTADKAMALAQTELKMARDRYGAGVGDNIQLLSAQDVLDRALDDQVDALARYDTARVNFASAQGQMETFH
jgi:outer membrane protein TolC